MMVVGCMYSSWLSVVVCTGQWEVMVVGCLYRSMEGGQVNGR